MLPRRRGDRACTAAPRRHPCRVATPSQQDSSADTALFAEPLSVLAVLLAVLGAIFWVQAHPTLRRIYRVVPLLIFCYFVPTALSNTGVIPAQKDFPLYEFISNVLLPASLMLLILSVDIPGILGLGRNAVILFLVAVLTVMFAGPIAYLALGWLIPDAATADTAWKGLAALSGSWIGGGANMIAIKESVGASDAIIGAITVVDVAIANVWMVGLLWYAANHRRVDERIGADASSIRRLEDKAERIALEQSRPTDLGSLLQICAIAFAGTWIATELAGVLDGLVPPGSFLDSILTAFTFKVLVVTALSVALSFTPVRRLEGAGASKVGSVFLYLLVASIGAKADFREVFRPENLPLLAIGALWMALHVCAILWLRRRLRAPIFFAAVGSKACIGGAASAPIVAHAFNPVLAPVGVLLAVGGYVFGTVAGLVCATLLKLANGVWFGS